MTPTKTAPGKLQRLREQSRPGKNTDRRDEKQLKGVFDYAKGRFAQGATPVEVSKELDMTPSNLSKIFKRFGFHAVRQYALVPVKEGASPKRKS